MKLYATTTTERASKGQGGNDYLDIQLTVSSERVSAGRVIVEPSGTGYKVFYIPPAGMTKEDGVTLSEITAEYIESKKKGEKQKGESVEVLSGSEYMVKNDKGEEVIFESVIPKSLSI